MHFYQEGCRWLSGHIFFAGDVYGEQGDRVVLEVAEPFVHEAYAQGWIRSHFWIRYGDLGSHIRLRLYGDSEVLKSQVEPALEAHVSGALPPSLAGRPRGELPAGAAPSPTPALAWIPYEPEVDRYGGPVAIELAEAFFRRSSEVSAALLRGVPPGDRSARLGRVLPTLVIMLRVFTDDPRRAAALAEWHRTAFMGNPDVGGVRDYRPVFDAGYAQQAEALREHVLSYWNAVGVGLALPHPLNEYLAAATAICNAAERLCAERRFYRNGNPVASLDEGGWMLLSSQSHMTNNRMGATPSEESYLMHMVARCLGEVGSAAGDRTPVA